MTLSRAIRRWWRVPAGVVVGAAAHLILSGYTTQLLSPVVSITMPTNSTQVSGTVLLQALADGPGVTQLQFQVSGQSVGPLVTAGACLYNWDSRTVPTGPHTISAAWRNAQGILGVSKTITVDVINGPTIRSGVR